MRAHILTLAIVLAGSVAVTDGAAQAPRSDPATDTAPSSSMDLDLTTVRSDRIFAISVGVPVGESWHPSASLLGINWTHRRSGRLGSDYSAGIMPYALAGLTLVGGARGGLALPVELARGVHLVPSAGVGFVGVAGPIGLGAAPFLHGGLAAVMLDASGGGLRVGTTLHVRHDWRHPVMLVEVGLADMSRHRRQGAR